MYASVLDLNESRSSIVNLPRSSNFKIEVKGVFRKQDNMLMIGHFEFTLQVTKNNEVHTVDRRYSDFDLLRRAITCQYPGLFTVPLPPKDAFIAFKKEDDDTVKERKLGIKNFLLSIISNEELAEH